MRRMREEPRESPFLIRRMTREDLPAVMELEKASFTNPWSYELLQRELGHDWSVIFLAEELLPEGGRRLLGISIFWIVHDEVHVLNVATAPEHRRRGVGRQLMERLLHWADHWGGVLRIELHVHADNPRAIALYRSLDFVEEGRHRAYALKEGKYVDSLSMARLHPHPPQLPE